MQVYVMRHGEAEPLASRDQDRVLTPRGQMQSREMGAWLAQSIPNNVDMAMVSPYVRAVQTYQQLSEVVSVQQMQICEDIVPAGSASLMVDYLRYWYQTHPECKHLLMVSHMPFVSYLVDEMTGQSYSQLFATGSIACLNWAHDSEDAEFSQIIHPSC